MLPPTGDIELTPPPRNRRIDDRTSPRRVRESKDGRAKHTCSPEIAPYILMEEATPPAARTINRETRHRNVQDRTS